MSESETPLPASTPADQAAENAPEQVPASQPTVPETDGGAPQADEAEHAAAADPAPGPDDAEQAEAGGEAAPPEGAQPEQAPEAEQTPEAEQGPESEQAPEAGQTPEAEQTPEADEPGSAPDAAPIPTPAPRPGPKPGVPSPKALAGKRPTATLLPAAPPVAEYDQESLTAAKAFGAVAEDGTVTVQDGTQVRTIGTTTESDHDAALDPFARKYLDLVAFLDLTEKKLTAPEHTQNELNRLLENLRKNMKEPQVVGDIPALRARAHDLREKAKEKIQELEAQRAEQRAGATRRRTEFVESIEALVATDPEQISWKKAGETMRSMVPTWKQMQSEDVSLDRPTEDALWKRLSAARSTFDRMRRQFFSQLDEKHTEAAAVKEQLVTRAEAMQDSTDWGPTVRAFKDLMQEWRDAPRGSRKKDDAQWKRFKAAQDRFFTARNADLEETEADQRQNLEVKESLLAEAQAIDPDKDLEAAKESLRSIHERWETAGKVPRSDMRRIEERLRSIERSVKKAEENEWRRTDPRTRARVEGASSQLHSAIASYEEALEKARAGGDPEKIAEAETALEARKEWLAVIERSARELG